MIKQNGVNYRQEIKTIGAQNPAKLIISKVDPKFNHSVLKSIVTFE